MLGTSLGVKPFRRDIRFVEITNAQCNLQGFHKWTSTVIHVMRGQRNRLKDEWRPTCSACKETERRKNEMKIWKGNRSMSRYPWTLAADVPDNSRATLICTPEIEFSPLVSLAHPSSPRRSRRRRRLLLFPVSSSKKRFHRESGTQVRRDL